MSCLANFLLLSQYVSDIMMGGKNTISMYNVCEDSLLATPLIFDLAILAELLTRIQYSTNAGESYDGLYSIMSLLSNMLKAPLVKPGAAVVNGFGRQRAALENFMRACIGLGPSHEMELEKKLTW